MPNLVKGIKLYYVYTYATLAFLHGICDAGSVGKYIFAFLASVSFIINLLFLSAGQVHADHNIQSGQSGCLTPLAGVPPTDPQALERYRNAHCAQGLKCQPETQTDPNVPLVGVCMADDTSVNCTCQSEGRGTPGNGFTCAGNPTVGYCGANQACYKKDGNISTADQSKFPGLKLRNIECREFKPTATCECLRNGTEGENDFRCTRSDTGEVATAFCGSAQDQCQNAPGEVFNNSRTNANVNRGTGFLQPDLFGQMSVNLTGIACRRPVANCRCDNPGSIGDGKNGFTCEQFGRTERDFCDAGNYACTDEPDNILVGGEGTERNIFGGAPLKGINCQVQKLPTPPPPPCMVWSGGAEGRGQCLQFATAVGDLSTQPTDFITRLFAILLSMAGGIALLLIIKAGYQMMVSRGNPEGINAGRDQLVAAIVGLIFLIFSFVILQVIGYDILRIPQIGGGGGPTGGNIREGGSCDGAGNNQCSPGLSCVSQGGRGGICIKSTGASCDVAGNNTCPAGQTCRSVAGRSGICQ